MTSNSSQFPGAAEQAATGQRARRADVPVIGEMSVSLDATMPVAIAGGLAAVRAGAETSDEANGAVNIEMIGEVGGESANLRAIANRDLRPGPPIAFTLLNGESGETPTARRSHRYEAASSKSARRINAADPRWVSFLHSRVSAARRNSFVRLGLSYRLAGALVAYDLDAEMVAPDLASALASALEAYDLDDPAWLIIIHEAIRRDLRERPELGELALKLLEERGASVDGRSPSSISAGPAEALRKAIERSDEALAFIKAHPGATHAAWRMRDQRRAAAIEAKAARRAKARRHRPENGA